MWKYLIAGALLWSGSANAQSVPVAQRGTGGHDEAARRNWRLEPDLYRGGCERLAPLSALPL